MLLWRTRYSCFAKASHAPKMWKIKRETERERDTERERERERDKQSTGKRNGNTEKWENKKGEYEHNEQPIQDLTPYNKPHLNAWGNKKFLSMRDFKENMMLFFL